MENPKNNPAPSSKPRRKLDIWNKIAVCILTLFLVGCISVFFILVNVINDPEGMRFSRDGLSTLSNSRIFDDAGELVFEFGAEIREDVTYEQLPQSVIDAFLAIEDSRYFEHSGFDLPRFMAAAITNLRTGDFSQGGSTLTMQMIDNAFTKNQEQKIKNESGGTISKLDQLKLKIQEIYLSLIAEQSISKEDILEYYVNRIWFGSGNNTRGIQKAAEYYFNKDVSELNLEEAAFLAGSVNAPAMYNPLNNRRDQDFDHLAAGTERRNTTLDLMLQHGYITQEEHDLAVNTDLALALDYEEQVSSNANEAYINQVINEAIDLTGQDPAIIPMDIYTSLNQDLQNEVDRVMNGEVIAFPNEAFDVGLSITDNATGEILAVGPGRRYHSDEVKQDNSINTKQPGSSMKPLLAYSSAFDLLGWSTNHTVQDVAKDYWHAGFNLSNSDGKYEGNISLAYALGVSKNTTAAATMIEMVDVTGLDYWIDFCKKLGFDDSVAEHFNPQYSIGGSDMFASPVQMSSAYSMFGNGGVRINAHRIRRIIRRSDNEEINGNNTPNELISTQAAWEMSYLLEKVVTGGYQNYNNLLYNPNFTTYAKSGTSDWGTDGLQYGIPATVIRDEWSIGYTDKVSIACWSGYTREYFEQGWYMDLNTLDQATAFHINAHLLAYMNNSMGFTSIPMPDGISEYRGGYIKTEFLEQGDSTAHDTSVPVQTTPEPTPDQSGDQTDDTTPEVDEAAKTACEGSGGSFDNGACSCPDGYYLNGTACEAIQVEDQPQNPDQGDGTETPENPDQSNPDQTNPDQPASEPSVNSNDQNARTAGTIGLSLMNLFAIPFRRFF